ADTNRGAPRASIFNDTVTPRAAVATVWPTTRHKLLTTKADTAVSPATTAHENFRLVNDTRTFQKPLSFATSNERYTGAYADGDREGEGTASGSTDYAACT